jgi:Zn-dependent alcohol dehydrogenase
VQVGKNVTDIKVGDKVGVGCISDCCMACQECEEVCFNKLWKKCICYAIVSLNFLCMFLKVLFQFQIALFLSVAESLDI